MKIERIVIGTDFSAPSLEAARWTAAHFAPGAELVLVYAIYFPEPPRFLRDRYPHVEELVETARKGAEERLRALARSLVALGAGRGTRTDVRVGVPSDAIAAAAAEHGAELVVVGPHGERARPWNLLGTTAQHLVSVSPVPVLLAAGRRASRPRSILVPLLGADETPSVMAWTHRLAEHFDADVTALHVVSSAVVSHLLAAAPVPAGHAAEPNAEQLRDEVSREVSGEADRWMAGLLAAGLPRDRVSSEVAFGEAGQEILATADRRESDLIVMGRARHAGSARRALFGSVTSEVLRGARCPVLVVGEGE
ncbi:MAG TPA: universal stress protein [Gemmatimonadaceae bacterium]|nr:universal stress protein [Gemmatimonadaceae bacterium]